MKTRKSGARHTLLLYRRAMDRYWRLTLLVGLVLFAISFWTSLGQGTFYTISIDAILQLGGTLALVLTVFIFLARSMAYVRAYPKYVKLVTPFLRMKISYRRIRTVHPMLVQQVFPPEKAKRSERKLLEPFYGKTAVVLGMKGYPMSPLLLRLFLPRQFFPPQFEGLVFIVPDWMDLSTEMDSFRGTQQRSIKDRDQDNRLKFGQW